MALIILRSLMLIILLLCGNVMTLSNMNDSMLFRKFLCVNQPCGSNAECIQSYDGGFCLCTCGFGGNPYEGCSRIEPSTITRIKIGLKFPIKLNSRVSLSDLYWLLVENRFYADVFVADKLRRWSRYIQGTIALLGFECAHCECHLSLPSPNVPVAMARG